MVFAEAFRMKERCSQFSIVEKNSAVWTLRPEGLTKGVSEAAFL